MAYVCQWIPWTKANPIHLPNMSNPVQDKAFKSLQQIFKFRACSREIDWPLNVNKSAKKSSRAPRRLIRISTAETKWNGSWSCEYVFSLKELKLDDLVEDDQKHSKVHICLCIHRHASFGLSVEGKVITTFTRRCSNCFVPYCKEINTNFNVWVLPSSRENDENGELRLPEIGGDDPSVIYVKPGYEANLDSLIQDTIRLTLSVKDTCSETCEKAEPTLQYIGGSKPVKSIDGRWSRLLELRNRSL
uniref:Uncharacterized protein n=1 Tax=Kalanchoe fedtschenkoi TaxID=63787 RepID=A0A7N0TX58_KALFE